MEGKCEAKSERCRLLPSAVATTGQNHHQPHEDVQCVHVNPHTSVRLERMRFSQCIEKILA